MIICHYVNDIVPVCLSHGIPPDNLYVVLPRSLTCVPLSDFTVLNPQSEQPQYYYLPWTAQTDTLAQALSSDIMFPDVYKELSKSVAYAFIASVEGDVAEFGTCSGYSCC